MTARDRRRGPGRITFTRTPNGEWRWVFREPGKEIDLVGNEDYDSYPAARAAAQRAYPDAELEREGSRSPSSEGPTTAEGDRDAGRITQWLALVVVLIAWSRRNRRGG
jgi:hypothetical protein